MQKKTKAAKAKKKRAKSKPKSKANYKIYSLRFLWILCASFFVYLAYLNYQVTQKLEGNQWSLPSRVYARPLTLSVGLKLKQSELIQELNLLSYRNNALDTPGSYLSYEHHVRINRRAFKFPNQQQDNAIIDITFNDSYVTEIYDVKGLALESMTLDPVLLSSFYADDGEDRIVLSYAEIPQSLIEILIAIEDRQFYQHYGINPKAIARALWSNIQAGKTVQGGSTLTQQLAKNLFLNSNKNLIRKINEAFYALIIEWHLDKQAILTAYVNQVFLTQQKSVAIHGFALASQVLFKKPLNQLTLDQQATLVAMIKGPSYYHPLKHPERILRRRNLVLDVMLQQDLIDESLNKQLKQNSLGVLRYKKHYQRFPAFIDLLKKQLPAHYDQTILKSSGLRIFSTLDPIVQLKAEAAVKKNTLLKQNKALQSASVIARYASGDVIGLVSDREPNYPGYNRAALAQRPIGSLIKPLLLYSLLENGESLATLVQDRAISLKQSDGKLWTPQNYDSKLHGEVSLYQALVYSYNLPFVRIGLEKGLPTLVETLELFKLQKNPVIYPSLLLGSIGLTPLETAQIYQTLANDGVYTPLTTIRFVTDSENQILTKRPVQSIALLNSVSTAQVQSAMLGVVQKGTARALKNSLPDSRIAGKTGTTDDYRDSWFVGFSEQLIGVVWMGNDENKPIHLTGSSGAMRLWSDIFKQLPLKPLQPSKNSDIEWVSTDASGQFLLESSCEGSQLLPFKKGEKPTQELDCEDSSLKKATNWIRGLFE